MDDVSLLVPEDDATEDDVQREWKAHADEIMKNFVRLGITQIVFGVLLMVGGIVLACSWPNYGPDSAAEGIWCGVPVLICGCLAITTKFYFYSALVITNLIMNIITSIVLGVGVVLAAISTFGSLGNRYEIGIFGEYGALNCGLLTSMVVCIYTSVIFGKVLNQKRQYSCCPVGTPMQYPGYAMVYVPPGGQSNVASPGAFMAVPGKQPPQTMPATTAQA